VLVVLGCVFAPLSVAMVWARDQVVDEHAYVRTVSPLSSNAAIDAAVSAKVTGALFSHVDVAGEAKRALPQRGQFLATPLAAGLRDVTRQAVNSFLATKQFNLLWRIANQQAHRELVRVLEGKGPLRAGERGEVSVDLTGTILAVRRKLDAQEIHVFDSIPKSALQRRYVIGHSRWLARARFIFKLQALTFVFPALAIAAWAAAIGLSRNRRRAVLGIGVGTVVTATAAIAVVAISRALYLDHVIWPIVPRDAGAAFFDTVTRLPRLGLRLELVGGIVLATGAAFWGRLRVEVPWVAEHKRLLDYGLLVAGLLVLAGNGHPTPRLLVEILVAEAIALVIVELLALPNRA
jgi:hypothetical protein